MQFFRKLGALAMVPAAAWVVLATLMAGMAVASAAPGERAAPALVICTTEGLQSPEAALPGGEPREAALEHCKWCQGFGKTPPLVPPAAAMPARYAAPCDPVVARPADNVAFLFPRAAFSVRAPPLPLI